MKKWNIQTFIGIGTLAGLFILLSLPGALISGLSRVYILAEILNSLIIGFSYSFIVLLFKKPGAVSLWSIIFGILAIPFPVMGPPGLFLKVIYSGFWGLLADIIYILLKKSEKVTAIVIGIVEIGAGIPLAVLFWQVLGMFEISRQYIEFMTVFYITGGIIIGGSIGYLGYILYKKIEKTNLVRRIQK